MHEIIRKEFLRLIKKNGLEGEEVTVRAATLSTAQAIGTPEDKDYPRVNG